MTDRIQGPRSAYECVEPELGELLWRRRDPALEPDLRKRLEDHVSICDACRLTLMIEGRIEGGLRAGQWSEGNRFRKPAVIGGGFALAASLVLMLILPPAARIPLGLVRGDSAGMGFVRPVEGQVLATDRPELQWKPIDGATAYQVEVSQVDGPWSWSGRSAQSQLHLPANADLPHRGTFRVIVEPIPADLTGLADVTVFFSRAGPGSYLSYRAAAAPLGVKILFFAGLALSAWWAVTGWNRRRLLAS